MNAIARVEEARGLTEKQRAFVDAMLKGKEPEAALEAAGYGDTVHPSQILASRAVVAAIAAGCDQELDGVVRIKATRAITAMLGEDTPAATRFQAAKWVLERNQADEGDEKPLSEMTPSELQELVNKLEKEKAERIIDVTPRSGV